MASDNEFFLVTPRNPVKYILKWLRVTHLSVDMKQVKNYWFDIIKIDSDEF